MHGVVGIFLSGPLNISQILTSFPPSIHSLAHWSTILEISCYGFPPFDFFKKNPPRLITFIIHHRVFYKAFWLLVLEAKVFHGSNGCCLVMRSLYTFCKAVFYVHTYLLLPEPKLQQKSIVYSVIWDLANLPRNSIWLTKLESTCSSGKHSVLPKP